MKIGLNNIHIFNSYRAVDSFFLGYKTIS